MGRRVIGWLAWLSGANARIGELEEENAQLRETANNLSRGYKQHNDTLERMFQAEDEQRRMRVALTQAAFDARPGGPVARAMHGILTGHILHPAKRVTEEE